MARQTENEYKNGVLFNGFDYENQAWVIEGKYLRCGHPDQMDCSCFGKVHDGELVDDYKTIERQEEQLERAEQEYLYI